MTDILEDALRVMVAAGAGLDLGHCIVGNADAPRRAGTYASLRLSEDTPRGYVAHTERQNGPQITTEQLTAVYSLQFYRGGAIAAARRFRTWAQSAAGLQTVEEMALEVGVPFVIGQPIPAVQRLDIPVGDKWEIRALIDLRVDYATDTAATVPTLSARSGTITLSGPGTDIERTVRDG